MNAAFAHGVASGDPLTDRVIIWTRWTTNREEPVVTWEVATDPDFADVVARGEQVAAAERDRTIKVDVTGLTAGTTYWYRFSHRADTSVTGRTRTLPEHTDQVRLAALSCSSYWSGHFSGYGHLARRDDLDLIMHLGDYIYDFPDSGELVRSPVDFSDTAHPDNRNWRNLDEVRRRYALWRSDENLRAAHQNHPFLIVWDNHDLAAEEENDLEVPELEVDYTVTVADTMRAFWEWTPTRPVAGDGSGEWLLIDDHSYPWPEEEKFIYRRVRIGDLVDIFALDAQSRRPAYDVGQDHAHVGEDSVLGRRQHEWVTDGLRESEEHGSVFKLVLNQAWFTTDAMPDLIHGWPLPRPGLTRWAKFPEERQKLMDLFGEISNLVMVTGDAHGNLTSDIVPADVLADGDYEAGEIGFTDRAGAEPGNVRAGAMRVAPRAAARTASVGVEFAASSLTRGGGDDKIAKKLPGILRAAGRGVLGLLDRLGVDTVPEEVLTLDGDRGAVVALTRALEAVYLRNNPGCQYLEWLDHGYGVLDITRDRVVAELWWQDKQQVDAPEVLGQQFVVWAEEDLSADPPRRVRQIDPVGHHGFAVSPTPRADL